MSGKSCLTHLIFFHDKVIHLVDQWKPAGVIFLDFSKSFNVLSQNTTKQKHNVVGEWKWKSPELNSFTWPSSALGSDVIKERELL